MDQKDLRNIIKEFAKQFAILVNDMALYPPDHSCVKGQLDRVIGLLLPLHAALKTVTLEIAEGFMVYEGVPFFEIRHQTERAGALFSAKQIRQISFNQGIRRDDLKGSVLILLDRNEAPNAQLFRKALLAKNIATINVDDRTTPEESATENGISPRKTYESSIEANKLLYTALQNGQPIPLDVVNTIAQEITEVVGRDPTAAMALTSLRDYDEYTFTHSANVAILSVAMAATLVNDPIILRQLARAAILHDIGKTMIPLPVLNKSGKLTAEEWHLLQQHPTLGVMILEDLKTLDRLPSLIAAQHHMKYDKTGYPSIAGMDQLHPFSLIVNICDIYDAITSYRVYKKPLPPDQALAVMLKLIGCDIYPQFFKIFLQIMGIYPPGSFLRLNTGEIVIVQRANSQALLQPDVKVITDKNGKLLPEPFAIHLAAAGPERYIQEFVSRSSLGLNAIDFFS